MANVPDVDPSERSPFCFPLRTLVVPRLRRLRLRCSSVLHSCFTATPPAATTAVGAYDPVKDTPDFVPPEPGVVGEPNSKFLSLPAELRNMIYESVLLSDQVYIDRANFSQPGLLRTNRQIRSETITMWYVRNIFNIDVNDLNPSVLMAFHRQAKHYQEDMSGEVLILGLGANWANLLTWLEWCHKEPAWVLGFNETDRAYRKAAARAFQIVRELRGGPWEVVARALEVYKKAVEEQNRGLWSWV